MCNEFIIEVLVKPRANQQPPTEEELDELEEILSECVDSYLDRLAGDSGSSDEDETDEPEDD